ncbi:MAG: transglycosylase domain-containing protein [Gloeomargarita sp. SKYBB_i_bin120]|nr:penicillin-binding protein [Gloeomargarita sp. SKYB120]MDW8178929.1 transglycosylase domain-containing protein [Gloeomargarita sp. SKYBB_i_bin120]
MSSKALSSSRRRSPLALVLGAGRALLQWTGVTLMGVALVGTAGAAGFMAGLAYSFRNLPDVRLLKTYVPPQTSYIYDIKGRELAAIHGEANREVVPLEQIAHSLKLAVLAIEDSHFYSHPGINLISIIRAVKTNWRSGRVVEGGSTLTMQLAKNLLLSPEQVLSRKVAEAVLAMRMEQVFTKDELLELYLNQVYWGHNNYGAETAAQSYFGKSARELTLAEGALMAGLIQAPEFYSPFAPANQPLCRDRPLGNACPAKQRQLLVLERLEELGWVTPEEAKAARLEPIYLNQITSFRPSKLPYVTDMALQTLYDKFGQELVQRGGLRVQTSVDQELQLTAEKIVRENYARLRAQGWGSSQLQMALVAVDPRTHYIKAIVGGVDYKKSQFNRAYQAQRQPGSAFKPFVYYAAFASGRYTPESYVSDSPVSYRDGAGWYSPRNYDGSFWGDITLRQAMAASRNVPAVRLGKEVGMERVVQVCRALGITSPMLPVTSLPLGAVDLTPLEMANAYATFASNGWYAPASIIVQVQDQSGQIDWKNIPQPKLVLDPWAAAALNSILQTVIESGTGTAAQIGRPAAGKTGTTSSERDIWFVGYVPQLAAAVWIGNDDYRPLGGGATGGTLVAPIWRQFMLAALKGVPVEKFTPPSHFVRPRPNRS